jgi:hypothetical protein
MTETAFTGPIGQFGLVQTSTAGTGILGNDLEHNPNRAPMWSDLGDSMMDPRVAYAYQPGHSKLTVSFFNNIAQIDYVPTTLSTNAFVSNTAVSSGTTTYTLNAASSANGTYQTTIIAPETGKATANLLAIDSTAAYLSFGSDGAFAVWNPAGGTGRCISITTSSSGDLGTWSIAGRDMYGYKITETIALSQGTSQSSGYLIYSQKAFKYVSSITNCSTPTSSGVSIGISDHYGMPLYTPYTGQNALINLLPTSYSSQVAVALSSANLILASTIVTQTSTTPDVRGIYESTTASNGTLRVQIQCNPTAANIAAITSTNVAPLFGYTQYSSV